MIYLLNNEYFNLLLNITGLCHQIFYRTKGVELVFPKYARYIFSFLSLVSTQIGSKYTASTIFGFKRFSYQMYCISFTANSPLARLLNLNVLKFYWFILFTWTTNKIVNTLQMCEIPTRVFTALYTGCHGKHIINVTSSIK